MSSLKIKKGNCWRQDQRCLHQPIQQLTHDNCTLVSSSDNFFMDMGTLEKCVGVDGTQWPFIPTSIGFDKAASCLRSNIWSKSKVCPFFGVHLSIIVPDPDYHLIHARIQIRILRMESGFLPQQLFMHYDLYGPLHGMDLKNQYVQGRINHGAQVVLCTRARR